MEMSTPGHIFSPLITTFSHQTVGKMNFTYYNCFFLANQIGVASDEEIEERCYVYDTNTNIASVRNIDNSVFWYEAIVFGQNLIAPYN